MVKVFMQGRTYAHTPGEAVAATAKKLRARNYLIVDGGITIRRCLVQDRPDITWWEWQAEVIEVPAESRMDG